MAKPTGVEDGSLFNGSRALSCSRQEAVCAKCRFQALPDLGRLPGLKANLLRALAGSEYLGLEVQTVAGQRTECVGEFQIDEVLRRLGGVQFRLRS